MVLLAGYDVQSAYTPNGVLYITGAPRFNHSGRVMVYRFDGENFTITQTLNGEQVNIHYQISSNFGWISTFHP